MTVFVPTTSDTLAGVRHTVTATDSLLINAGISVGSTNTRVIDAIGTTASVFIAGMVFGGGSSTAVQISQGRIEIGQTGSVYSNASGGSGAILLSAGAGLTNDGTIAATQGLGVIMTDADTNVMNSGRISGGNGGVFMGLFDNDNQQLTNTGSISSSVRPDLGLRFGHGVQIEGDFATISNAGDIRAIATGKAGIHVSGYLPTEAASDARITNDGVVSSLLGWGVDGGDNQAAGFTLINNGTISGGSGGIRTTAGIDVVTNTGVVHGRMTLGAGADRFFGNAADIAQSVFGEAGTDSLVGGAFDDLLFGGTEADILRGGAGDDSLYGGSGNDDLVAGAGDDNLVGGTGDDDYFVATLADRVTESAGAINGVADRIYSSIVSIDLNLFRNVEGAVLTGISALMLTGSAGANTLAGNAAANRISGGLGRDTLTGGDGRDTFVFAAAADAGTVTGTFDTITDFSSGVDRIDLRGFLAGGIFQGSTLDGFRGVAYDAATHTILGSTDSSFLAEFRIMLQAGATVVASDFIF